MIRKKNNGGDGMSKYDEMCFERDNLMVVDKDFSEKDVVRALNNINDLVNDGIWKGFDYTKEELEEIKFLQTEPQRKGKKK